MRAYFWYDELYFGDRGEEGGTNGIHVSGFRSDRFFDVENAEVEKYFYESFAEALLLEPQRYNANILLAGH